MELIESEVASAQNEHRESGIDSKFVNEHSQLRCLKHFPQPIFLIKKDMTLVETNEQGKLAIENNWVGLNRNKKLHFNCRDNDNYVHEIVTSLTRNADSTPSQRFILRSLDMQHRVSTLALQSTHKNSNLIFSIHDELLPNDRMMQSFSRAFGLSSSESKIVKLMVKGLKPKEIAFELGISLNTVRSHLRTLYAKMQVRSYNDALTQAIKLIC
ncbi:MAG: helix-turn-helix transcriptional regulator [Acidiferrobacterales bacterium]|nr:helix-turn-helix transcriptional regulator [Acidiferrobacterales bacterium]